MRKLPLASAQHEYSGLSGITHLLPVIIKVYPSKLNNTYSNLLLLASTPSFFLVLTKLKRRLLTNRDAPLQCSCKDITEDLQLPPLDSSETCALKSRGLQKSNRFEASRWKPLG